MTFDFMLILVYPDNQKQFVNNNIYQVEYFCGNNY